MTSSTPLPPPTEEQLETVRGYIGSLALRECDPDIGDYLRAVAEGLRVMKIRVEDGEGRAMDWCFATEMRRVREGAAFDAMWQPVKEEVGDDD